MTKKRVYELAKELGLENKELIARLEAMGITGKTHSSSLEEAEVERIYQELKGGVKTEVEEKRITSTVIRRRAVRPTPVEEPPVSLTPNAVPTSVVVEKPAEAPPPPKKEKEKPELRPVAPPKEKKERERPKETPAKEVVAPVSEAPVQEKPTVAPEVTPEPPPPPPEIAKPAEVKPPKWEPEKKKGKKPVEVIISEPAPAKKKVFMKKLVERKLKVIETEIEEWPARPREEKKVIPPERMKKTEITVPKAIKRRIKVVDTITVGDLAKKMGVKAAEVINKLMGLGVMANINQALDFDTASLIASEFSYTLEREEVEYDESLLQPDGGPRHLVPRAPVVTVMGHVDHGKTSLLDAIRKTNVTEEEAGGITQAIGAYHVRINNRDIVFLDTPGHEAFTAMRARGAQVTDVVVLVVAADDGVMDQTVEAINHAKAAKVPILVAINKIDKPNADPERVKRMLAEYDLVPEEWGGDTVYCEVSAKQRTNIEELLEMILLQADILELKADPTRPARGTVIEAKLDKGRGPVATILVQEGTLREGDIFVCRSEYGRVRAIINDKGRRIKEAGPSMPVEVIGFSRVPQVGAQFVVVNDDKKAKAAAEYWMRKEREKELSAKTKITLEQLYARMKEGTKELNVILRADVQGSIEAISEALKRLGTSDIQIKIIHSSTGNITETDVMLASSADAVIIGFNVKPDARVLEVAEQEGVEIKIYNIIYDLVSDVKAAMEGMLEPIYKEVILGRAEVRQLFRIPKVGVVAGCFVSEGKIARNSSVRIIRNGEIVHEGKMASLKRLKDDVREVAAGFECGVGIENFDDLKEGDIIEAYVKEKMERKL
ncbi:MAG TPA: translation initiation factor IF-2 [Syntrophales bacterium]|nr:translation initiation factor IF-2 [Syntrophales bacterium]HOL59873.1 translation initiation factor IF-2 [Syntrophales bacterium]HPO36020.1 translation initiation factor IF-2 [Syntrophales bacterium]